MSLYVRLDTLAATDPKLLAVGPNGFTLYVKGLCYSKDQLLDGFIPTSAIDLISVGIKHKQRSIDALLEHELWFIVPGGYTVTFTRWARHQTTKDEVEVTRSQNRERKRSERERKRLAALQPQLSEETAAMNRNGHTSKQTSVTEMSQRDTEGKNGHVTDVSQRDCHGCHSRPPALEQSTEHRVQREEEVISFETVGSAAKNGKPPKPGLREMPTTKIDEADPEKVRAIEKLKHDRGKS